MALQDSRPLDLNSDDQSGGGAEAQATFGRYLLFKRLKTDALGELYRAGAVGTDAIERIVSLRLFNASGIQGDRFREACGERDALKSTLRGGPFAELVDFGCKGGVAYVVHDFVSGRSLAELLTQAREKSYPVPLEHTLHVMDRIAIGLQNAYEKRLAERRITHGFLVPDFVHISGEGEIRLTGFETSGGLLALDAAGPTRAALAGYVSPEVNAGHPPKASDDVYSLGAIFAELLTGEPLPALNPAESSRWVAAAQLAAEAAPLPDNIRHLLRESLLPRDQRIQNAEQWHKALVELTNGSDPTSTTFDVAFFMHTLFGDELDREAELIEAEMQADVPPPVPKPVAAPTEPVAKPAAGGSERPTLAERLPELAPPVPSPAPSVEAGTATANLETEPVTVEPEVRSAAIEPAPVETEPATVEAETEASVPEPARPPRIESKSQAAAEEPSNRLWIVAGAIVLVIGLGAGGYFLFGPPSREAAEPIQVTAAPRVEAAAPPEAVEIAEAIADVPPPVSPEELESQVRSLVAQRAGDLEANLKAEYDQRLVELRKQLEEARKAATTPAPVPVEPEPAPVAEQPARPSTPPDREASRGPAERPRVAERETAAQQPAAQTFTQASPEPARKEPPTTEPPAVETRAPATTPVTPPEPKVEAKPEPGPKTASVEPGSIVQAGPDVTPPTLVRQPRAVYPPAAARLSRRATVRLRILVSEEGQPVEVEQISEKAGLGFDSAALRAAKKTVWTPPQKNGVPVKMWVELSIDFRP